MYKVNLLTMQWHSRRGSFLFFIASMVSVWALFHAFDDRLKIKFAYVHSIVGTMVYMRIFFLVIVTFVNVLPYLVEKY